MKVKMKISVEFYKEFDSEWYDDKNPDKLLLNVTEELNGEYALDIIMTCLTEDQFTVKAEPSFA